MLCLLCPGKNRVSFDKVVEKKPRQTAAGIFYQLLVLKTHSFVNVEQPEAFSDIFVTNTRERERVVYTTISCHGERKAKSKVSIINHIIGFYHLSIGWVESCLSHSGLLGPHSIPRGIRKVRSAVKNLFSSSFSLIPFNLCGKGTESILGLRAVPSAAILSVLERQLKRRIANLLCTVNLWIARSKRENVPLL